MLTRRRLIAALALAPFATRAQIDMPIDPMWEGKDVMLVPIPDDVVDRMLSMAKLSPDHEAIDLGPGDGRIAIAAAKRFGARALGIEVEPDLVQYANRAAAKAGVGTA